MDYNQDIQISTVVCEKHGEYEQKSFQIPMFKKRTYSHCPQCEAERKADEDQRKRAQDDLIRRIRMREKLGAAAVPKRFENKRLGDYLCDTPEKTAALSKCREYAENFKESFDAGRNLILIGLPGTGKTHLGTAIANGINNNTHYTAAYRTIGGVLQAIKQTFSSSECGSEGEIINGLTSVDLLVLDEIGATREAPSDFELATIFAIINGRYEDQKPTVIISNLSAEALTNAMGERCVDRLREGSPVVVQFGWASARRGVA